MAKDGLEWCLPQIGPEFRGVPLTKCVFEYSVDYNFGLNFKVCYLLAKGGFSSVYRKLRLNFEVPHRLTKCVFENSVDYNCA